MKTQEERYLIKERAAKYKGKLPQLKKELEEMESLWSKYSSDCLGHGITHHRLMINYLEK